MSSLKKKISSNLIAEILNKIVPLVILMYVPNILGTAQFGLAQYAISIIEISLAFVVYGFFNMGSIEIGKTISQPNEVSRIFSSIFILKIVHALLTIIALVLLVNCFPSFSPYKNLIYSLLFVLLIAPSESMHVISPLKKWHSFNLLLTVLRFFSMFLIIIMIKNPDDVILYPIILLAPNSILGIITLLKSMKQFPFIIPKWCDLKYFYKKSSKFAIIYLMTILADRFDILIIERLGSLEQTGIYAAPARLSHSLNQISFAILAILYSEVLQISNKEDLTSHIKKSSWILSSFLSPVIFGIWFINSDLLERIFGPEFSIASIAVSLLFFGSFFSAIFQLFSLQVLLKHEKIYIVIFIQLISMISGGLISITTFDKFGISAIALGVLTSKILTLIPTLYYSKYFLNSLPKKELLYPIIAGSFMFTMLLFVKANSMLINILLGGVFYTFAYYILNRKMLHELMGKS